MVKDKTVFYTVIVYKFDNFVTSFIRAFRISIYEKQMSSFVKCGKHRTSCLEKIL